MTSSTDHRPFKQVDVFTDRPYHGNPVAVVLDARDLVTAQMQAIARWTNLSETTFVLPPTQAGADYRLRIFTPTLELPFAGHPTLGTAHALLESGRVTATGGRLVQQCERGLVSLRIEADTRRLFFRLPEPALAALDTRDAVELARALRVDATLVHGGTPRRIDVGASWITVELPSAEQVLAVEPDMAAIDALSRRLGPSTGVTIFGAQPAGGLARYEVRSFAPAGGAPEDPVCGSGNGCVAAWLRASGRGMPYLARQGRAVGRDGYIAVEFPEPSVIEIGGAAVTCIDGTITL